MTPEGQSKRGLLRPHASAGFAGLPLKLAQPALAV
jgi:hypothetical protein